MEERQVKGIWFLDLAKVVRKMRDLPWERYLTGEDMEMINANILPAQWYPLELYDHLGSAAFDLVGEGKTENAQVFGRFMVDRILEDEAMKRLLLVGDPLEGIKRFNMFRTKVMNFGEQSTKQVGDKKVLLEIFWPPDQHGILAFVHDIAGRLGRLIELNGGKNVKITFSDQDLDNNNSLQYTIEWE